MGCMKDGAITQSGKLKGGIDLGRWRCGFTFNNLSSSCCGMPRWKCPAGRWHGRAAFSREAGLHFLSLVLKALHNNLSSILAIYLLTSKPDKTVPGAPLLTVCFISYPLFTTHLKALWETFSNHPAGSKFLVS